MKKKIDENLITRPPVVVVLGHVDSGKTSILDAIRKTNVAEKESGGITQHIGAYQVEKGGKKITFLDTPGHEAFSAMRSRGANVADIAILVVDVVEGVKAQTKEAITHIKKSGVHLIVALNKMDKPEANPEKAKRELAKEDIIVESMAGKIPSVEVSATTQKGIPELLEMILLVAEMEGLKGDAKKPAQGIVIESCMDNMRGATATLLLRDGSLKTGDIIATPSCFTKIKSLENFKKEYLIQAFPSDPVVVFGFNQPPRIGEEFKVFPDQESAESYASQKEEKKFKENITVSEEQRILNLVLKADVAGSLEAIEGILSNIPQDKVVLNILRSGVGSVNESDMKLALGSKALVLGFRVKVDSSAKRISEREKMRIIEFDIIYNLVEEVRKIMEKVVAPEQSRTDLGKMKVLAKFLTDKNRQIIGGRVTEGELKKGALLEVYRNEEKIGSGRMINLQRNKKDADTIIKGDECGILFEGEVKIEEGDIVLAYTEQRIKQL